MIKRLLAKLKKNSNKKTHKNSIFNIDSLLAVELPYYKTEVIENAYGVDVVYKVEIQTLIINYKTKRHIKSNKSLKELLHTKNLNNIVNKMVTLSMLEKFNQFKCKYNIGNNNVLTYEEIVKFEDFINSKIKTTSKRTLLQR